MKFSQWSAYNQQETSKPLVEEPSSSFLGSGSTMSEFREGGVGADTSLKSRWTSKGGKGGPSPKYSGKCMYIATCVMS